MDFIIRYLIFSAVVFTALAAAPKRLRRCNIWLMAAFFLTAALIFGL